MDTPKILFFDIAPYYRVHVFENGSVKIFSDSVKSKGREMSQWNNQDGYRMVSRVGSLNSVHAIVAYLVHGARPEGLVINHIDGDKNNNHPSNLEYCTIAENIAHAMRTGLHVSHCPENHGRYIDGRSKDPCKYKHNWYVANRERCLSRANARYARIKNGS